MKMPSRGSTVTVDGYGTGIFAGASNLQSENGKVMLKFEGVWNDHDLNDGYGLGIVSIPIEEFNKNRVRREQQPDGTRVNVSTEKRDKIFNERFNGSGK